MGARVALATNKQLLDALADQIRTEYAASDVDVQVEPRLVPIPETVCVDMYPGAESARDTNTAGMGEWAGAHLFTVRVRIGTADSEASQDVLLDMYQEGNTLSVADAIYSDTTLNGLATSVDIQDSTLTGFVLFPLPDGTGMLGFSVNVLVIPADT